ncbi:MAG: radical SAM protein [Planctomycetota bacterium]|nr:radical SAM protein [Planctomycetota bacterium]
MNAREKLRLLADEARYDISCACGSKENLDDHRRRGPDGLWLYPTSVPRGGTSVFLKTLLSSVCANDCRYCPLRAGRDTRRTTLDPSEIARLFMDYVRQREVWGLFLSSGVLGSPDNTMDRLLATARILRKRYRYRGFLHLKVIPGATDGAIEEALRLASAVSLNVEAPTPSTFRRLSSTKRYEHDIVRSVRLISRLTGPNGPHRRVKQTTQFVVGAADETDTQIVQATGRLYRRWGLNRVYFSAYQHGLGDPSLPGEQRRGPAGDVLMREHRLYQVDWLIRKYGFAPDEIPFGNDGNLPLMADPKSVWADRHPERFPVDLNRADRHELLRVPGFGPVTVRRILACRRGGGRIHSLRQLGPMGRRLARAARYVIV